MQEVKTEVTLKKIQENWLKYIINNKPKPIFSVCFEAVKIRCDLKEDDFPMKIVWCKPDIFIHKSLLK